mmetsp:Transcript_21508/g.33662  ORF Transcript_21508/g.33662 Transcript_21508/m.33662 type:complete len:222 (-) Transcript_21508:71-736(-)
MSGDGGSEEELAIHSSWVVSSQLDLSPLVGREESKRPALKPVVVGIVLTLGRELKQDRLWQRRRSTASTSHSPSTHHTAHSPHSAETAGWRRWCCWLSGRHPKPNDSVNIIEVGAVAVRHSTEVGKSVVIPELNNIASLESFQMCVVCIAKHESLMRNNFEGLAVIRIIHCAVGGHESNVEPLSLLLLLLRRLFLVLNQLVEPPSKVGMPSIISVRVEQLR